tara:strand:+ start:47 stop:643 length:597 start_codon:yes stop_codon:yes gene_type:complete
MKKIQLYGAGGHAYSIIELVRSLKVYLPVQVVDDNPKLASIIGVPVLSSKDILPDIPMIISVGNNIIRKQISEKNNLEFPSFIHDSVVLYPSSKIGVGSVVFPNCVIDADVSLGDFCIVNNNATVSHNVFVESFVHISIQASVAGGVSIGEGSLIGAGSVILPNIKIGKWATIGAGAIVTKDVPDHAVVYGNPARIII